MTDRIGPLLKMLASGRESALLRFSLGSEYADAGDHVTAAEHLARCLELDRNYSAAWKLLGKCLSESGKVAEAADTFAQGIEVAEGKGDRQAAKEMAVFLRRLQRQASNGG